MTVHAYLECVLVVATGTAYNDVEMLDEDETFSSTGNLDGRARHQIYWSWCKGIKFHGHLELSHLVQLRTGVGWRSNRRRYKEAAAMHRVMQGNQKRNQVISA